PNSNNKLLAIGKQNGEISLWDTSSGKQNDSATIPQNVVKIVFDYESNDKQLVLVAIDGKGTVRRFYTDGKKFVKSCDCKGLCVKEFPTKLGNIKSLALNPMSEELATIDKEGDVQLYYTRSSKPIKLTETKKSMDLSFSPDGTQIAVSGKDGTVIVFNKEGKKLYEFQTQEGNINTLAFSPVNTNNTNPNTNSINLLATGGYDDKIRLIDISSNKPTPLQTQKNVISVSFSNDSKLLATTGDDGKVLLWDVKDDKIEWRNILKTELDKRKTKLVEFSPKSNLLATVEEDDVVRLWDISGKKLNPIEIKTNQKNIDLVAFIGEGNLVATRGKDEGKIKLWEFKDDKFEEKNLSNTAFDEFQKQQKQKIYSVAFSSDAKGFATTTKDNSNVQLWEINGKKKSAEFPTQQINAYVAFSPDGTQLATGGEGGTLKLWDTNGIQLKQFKTQQKTIYSIVFSPDANKLVIIGSEENKNENLLTLWDASGNELKQFEIPLERIKRVKFSPDHKRLVTIGNNGNARLWQVGEVEDLLRLTCHLVPDYLKHNPNVAESDRHLCDE
ncbi:MAG: WD40 repeat domain-containing protein, partial [Rhizonema sp. NSF051]|nr:WD40 repeat domain-containing protein [Rhizonema sp. NSF051]